VQRFTMLDNINPVYVESILIAIIIAIQFTIASRSFIQIRMLGNLLNYHDKLKIESHQIPIDELTNKDSNFLLKNLKNYQSQEEPEPTNEPIEDLPETAFTSVNLICISVEPTPSMSKIVESINVYLLRNVGAASDFNLIRDIVERNTEAEDSAASNTISVPLYLGLMGTILGIVFGLLSIPGAAGADEINLDPFIRGVSIAMFASFCGLFLTVINSNFSLKTARSKLETDKNQIYTFFQTELLPVLNQSISSSVHDLHQNLVGFNSKFSENIQNLSGLLNKNHDALIAQESILQTLEKINITQFAHANVKILKELKSSTSHLSQFNKYITDISGLVGQSSHLASSFDKLLEKTNNFKGLAEKIDSRVDEGNALMGYVKSHFSELKDRGEVTIGAVKKVEDVMIRSLGELEIHTKQKMASIKEITMKEEDLMVRAFENNRSQIAKLSLLENIASDLKDFKINSTSQITSLASDISNLKMTMDESTRSLKKINNNSVLRKIQNLFEKIAKWF
jgi:hypothetical protein